MAELEPQWCPRTESSDYCLLNLLELAATGMARFYIDIVGKTAKAGRVVIEDADGESAEICIEQPAELIEYPKPDE